jgi:hypothetical protein
VAKKIGNWNPARVLTALGRIGYDPVEAILDIVDNSVSAGANRIAIDLGLRNSPGTATAGAGTHATIEHIAITDNGSGMGEAALENALTLGSSPEHYADGSLSKFGMGLKSASSSLGTKLEIVSCDGSSSTLKAVLDQKEIVETGEYSYDLDEASAEDIEALYSDGECGTGTLIRVSDIYSNMPKPTNILEGLEKKIGVTYFPYLKDKTMGGQGLTIEVDKKPILPIDPLFTAEIPDDESGNLDEHDWDGLSVKWIVKDQTIQLDPEGRYSAGLAISQLPHPPSIGDSGLTSAQQCRKKYLIAAGNYGFYIYRNNRLISWADSLGGMIGLDQDLYSFRGRLDLTSESDDLLRIDVAKSQIQLSEMAHDHLVGIVSECKKKSINAWKSRSRALEEKKGVAPHDTINEALDNAAKTLDRDDELDEQVASEVTRKKITEAKKKAATKETTTQESDRLRKHNARVQLVEHLDNNRLWERAHDPEHGLIVRVNKRHRYYRTLLASGQDNAALVYALDTLFFGLACGEYKWVSSADNVEKQDALLADLLDTTGAILSDLVKDFPDNLSNE